MSAGVGAGGAGAASSFFLEALIPLMRRKSTNATIIKFIMADKKLPYFTVPNIVSSDS